jgi:hypothetical protein
VVHKVGSNLVDVLFLGMSSFNERISQLVAKFIPSVTGGLSMLAVLLSSSVITFNVTTIQSLAVAASLHDAFVPLFRVASSWSDKSVNESFNGIYRWS